MEKVGFFCEIVRLKIWGRCGGRMSDSLDEGILDLLVTRFSLQSTVARRPCKMAFFRRSRVDVIALLAGPAAARGGPCWC